MYLENFKLVNGVLANGNAKLLDIKLLDYLYPMAYLKKIKNYSNKIDPIIILSLIRQESAFNPNARSRVGALGLMQLMPGTARSLKRGVRKRELLDPSKNILLGVKYIKYLLKKYDNNLIYTLMAYNAGERNIARWGDFLMKSDKTLDFIEEIPFRETRLYVKLILRNIFFYNFIENNKIDLENMGLERPIIYLSATNKLFREETSSRN